LNHPKRGCICTQREIEKYRRRVSGPILDRIDIHIRVPAVDIRELSGSQQAVRTLESSAKIRMRVIKAREIQAERFTEEKIHTNAEMRNKHIKKYCRLSKEAKQMLVQAGISFQLSARSYFKIIKVARTIADLDGLLDINLSHMAEALQYRPRIQTE
jgi:magnesium chelatase family protein